MEKIRIETDLSKFVQQVKEDMDRHHIPYDNSYPIELYEKALKILGTCRYGEHRITIHKEFFLCSPNEDLIRSVICHELIHSAPCCRREGHKGKWKAYANKMTNLTKNEAHVYSIHRTEKMNLLKYTEKVHKNGYGIYCPNCDKIIGIRLKKTRLIKNIENYRCGKCNCKELQVKIIDLETI